MAEKVSFYILRIFRSKIAHIFLTWIELINISNRLVLSFQKICFLLFFKLKFFKLYYNKLKIIKFWGKNILFRIITQDSCINRYLNLKDIVHLKILDVYKGRGREGGAFGRLSPKNFINLYYYFVQYNYIYEVRCISKSG